jgi:hypothetical protein
VYFSTGIRFGLAGAGGILLFLPRVWRSAPGAGWAVGRVNKNLLPKCRRSVASTPQGLASGKEEAAEVAGGFHCADSVA